MSKGLITVQFSPLLHAGNVSVPGVKAGDVAMNFISDRLNNVVSAGNSIFDAIVITDDQVVQNSDGTTTDTITALFVRP